MKMISVIIPLYNTARYLSEALQSVLAQTYRDFELICIDDRSTDDTATILATFQKKDDRIKILANEEHLGAAVSRNKGLKEAQGKYVIFLDGDDIFDEEMLEKAYHAMERYDADIVMFEYMHVPSDEIYIKRTAQRSAAFLETYSTRPFSVKTCMPEEFPNWSDAVCDKMFRRKFINDHHIRFQDLPSCNDVYFSKMATYCAERIVWLDDSRVMIYARDHTEPSRISNARDPMCAYHAMERLAGELQKRKMMNNLAAHFYHRCLMMLLNVLKKEKKEERKGSFYEYLHDDGIARLIAYGKDAYDRIGLYERYLLKGFQDNAYESRWFDALDTYFQVYLRANGDKICQFIIERSRKGKTVVIWGMGINGTSLLAYLNAHSVRVHAVVDSDEKKQGSLVEGYEVQDPSLFLDAVDHIIITTSDRVHQDVSDQSKESGTVVTNAFELLL